MTGYTGTTDNGKNSYNGKRLTNNIVKTGGQTKPATSVPPQPATPSPAAAPAQRPGQADPLIGRWRQDNATITTILPNNIAKNGAPGRPEYVGKWTRDGSRYIIDWTDGLFIDTLRISGGDKLMRFGKDGRWNHFATRIR
jgi:hypothetical protein